MSTATVPRATGYPVPASGAALNSEPVRTQLVNIVDFLEGGNIAQGNIDVTEVAALAVANTWTANQTYSATLTVGANDTGYDVTFYGATAGAYMLWDESADTLKLVGGAATNMQGPLTVGVDNTGYDVQFFGATSGAHMLWDESADTLKLVGGAKINARGTVTVGADDTGYDVQFFGATSGAYMLWDESADQLKLVGGATLDLGDNNITNVGNIALDSISADGTNVLIDNTLVSVNGVAVANGAGSAVFNVNGTTGGATVHLTNNTTGTTNSDGMIMNMSGVDMFFINRESGKIEWRTSDTVRASITSLGSFLAGTAALSTTATDGFLYIPSCAGAPSGTPTDHSNMSAIIHDTSNNRIYLYNHVSNAWQYAALT